MTGSTWPDSVTRIHNTDYLTIDHSDRAYGHSFAQRLRTMNRGTVRENSHHLNMLGCTRTANLDRGHAITGYRRDVCHMLISNVSKPRYASGHSFEVTHVYSGDWDDDSSIVDVTTGSWNIRKLMTDIPGISAWQMWITYAIG